MMLRLESNHVPRKAFTTVSSNSKQLLSNINLLKSQYVLVSLISIQRRFELLQATIPSVWASQRLNKYSTHRHQYFRRCRGLFVELVPCPISVGLTANVTTHEYIAA